MPLRRRVIIIVCLAILNRHSLRLLLIKLLHTVDIRSWGGYGQLPFGCLVEWLRWCQRIVLLILLNRRHRPLIPIQYIYQYRRLPHHPLLLALHLLRRLPSYKLITPLVHMCLTPFHQPVVEFHLAPLPILFARVLQEVDLLGWEWVTLVEII